MTAENFPMLRITLLSHRHIFHPSSLSVFLSSQAQSVYRLRSDDQVPRRTILRVELFYKSFICELLPAENKNHNLRRHSIHTFFFIPFPFVVSVPQLDVRNTIGRVHGKRFALAEKIHDADTTIR